MKFTTCTLSLWHINSVDSTLIVSNTIPHVVGFLSALSFTFQLSRATQTHDINLIIWVLGGGKKRLRVIGPSPNTLGPTFCAHYCHIYGWAPPSPPVIPVTWVKAGLTPDRAPGRHERSKEGARLRKQRVDRPSRRRFHGSYKVAAEAVESTSVRTPVD